MQLLFALDFGAWRGEEKTRALYKRMCKAVMEFKVCINNGKRRELNLKSFLECFKEC